MTEQEAEELAPTALWEVFKRKLMAWIIVTIDPLLLIIHLTLIYIAFLRADDLVLAEISRSFGDLIDQSEFAAALLKGIKIFSALGVAVGYALHTIYTLYLQAKHVIKVFTENGEVSTTNAVES